MSDNFHNISETVLCHYIALGSFLILYEYRDRYSMFECVDEESGDITKKVESEDNLPIYRGRHVYIYKCMYVFIYGWQNHRLAYSASVNIVWKENHFLFCVQMIEWFG